jgi:UDP-3-O-[3-hydroxymyristoyl] glucosamine N-acyltransferase
MGKLKESLDRSSDYISADILPSWTSVVITLAPVALRALFRRHERKRLKKEVAHHVENYVSNYHKPQKAIKDERKAIVDKYNLPAMSQKDFDNLPIKEEKRFCPPGFDYSDIKPGKTPCLFDDVDKKTQNGLKKIAALFGNKSPISYLGGGGQWPPNSYFGSNVIIGRGSSLGSRSVINRTLVGESVTLGSGCIGKECKINDGANIGPSFVGLGGVVIGDNCRIGAGTDLRPYPRSNNGGYIIGDNAIIENGFKIAGKDNLIKNNATIGPMSNLTGVNILKNGLSIDVGGVIKGCTFSDGSAEYASNYTMNRCLITGDKASTVLPSAGDFNHCELKSKVITAIGSNYNGCSFSDLPYIAGHSQLTGCRVSSDTSTVVDSNSVLTGGVFENTILNGKKKEPIKACDVSIHNSELTHTHIDGDGSELSQIALGEGCEIKGTVRLDESVQIHSDLKIRQAVLSDEFMPSIMGAYTVSFYKTSVNTENLKLHKASDDPARFRFISGNFDSLKTVTANHEQLFFSKGLFDGSIYKPSLDALPDIQPLEIERPKLPEVQNKELTNEHEPPIEAYDESYSVSNPSYQGYEEMQQEYEDMSQNRNSHETPIERDETCNISKNTNKSVVENNAEMSHEDVIKASPLASKGNEIDHNEARQAIKGYDINKPGTFDAESVIKQSEKNAKAKGIEQDVDVTYEFFNR